MHGVGGVAGGLFTGIFATKALSRQASLLAGGWHSFGIQVAAIVLTIILSVVMTWVIAKAVAVITPLRVNEKAEATGLDLWQHGETIVMQIQTTL